MYDVLLSTYPSKANFRRKKPKEPRAYFMPALLLISWGIETCAGNHNKENVTEAEILPWENPHRCLEASTGDLHSGHMTLMSPLDRCHSLQVTVSTECSSHLVLKLWCWFKEFHRLRSNLETSVNWFFFFFHLHSHFLILSLFATNTGSPCWPNSEERSLMHPLHCTTAALLMGRAVL